MAKIIIQLAWRECAFFVVPILAAMLIVVLLTLAPFRFFDTFLAILSVTLGFVLAKKPFADDGGTRAFVFSRSYSPKRLFLVRWAFGVGVIVGVTLLLVAIFALGIREAVQKSLFQNGWYPMVRYHEMHVLWTVLLGGLLSFQTTIFFVIRNRFLPQPKLGFFALWMRRILNLILVLFAIGVALFLLYLGSADLMVHPPYFWAFYPFLLVIFGVPALLQTALMPWFGVYCYRNMEVES
ncbi:MAG: hypothetical protein FWC43_09965 [Planctomycetaceae bacterium]|nr:hypothetical protein [Planctomycetaceae bacterium]